LIRLAFPLVLIAFIVSGCSKGGFSKRGAAGKVGVFRYAINATPKTFDPGKVQDVDTTDLILNVFEGLVAYGEKNTIEPKIAESYSSTDGGKTWIFKLRHGVNFHNGREVTAEDFSWTLDRNCAKDLGSPTAEGYLSDIVGVKDRISGKSEHIDGVTVVDPFTLKIELDQPRPYFIGKMTYPCAFVLCKEAVGSGQIDKASQMIGAGPFKLETYMPEQQVNIVAFKDYYAGVPTVEKIERPVVKDAATRLVKFKAGDLDQLSLERKDIEGVQADPELKAELQYQMRPAVYYIGLNLIGCPSLRDAHVRRALAMAIDRTRLDRDLLGGMPEAHGLLTPGVIGFRENYKGLPYNPAGARAELAEAGFPDGKGFPPIELAYRADAGDAQVVCEAVQESLKQNLSIAVNVRTMEWNAYLAARNDNKLQLYFLSWYADYLDPQNLLSFLLTTDSKLNHDGYSNAQFDALCKEADSIFDEKKRIALYNRAEDIAVLDGARIPLYFQRDAILTNPRITGVRSNIFGQLPNTTVKVR
jgi:oligopeptide transport system substrate-binding protein